MPREKTNVREAVGIFDNFDAMQDAISELEESGFERRLISVLGSEHALKERFGTTHVKTRDLEDNPDAPRAPDIKSEELALGQGVLVGGGMLVGVVAAVLASGGIALPGAVVTTAVIGGAGGTAIGAVLAKLLGDKYAEFFQRQIDEGGLLLWVNTPNKKMEGKAQSVMRKHGASDVHVHELSLET